jgi:hypothetical protein
MTLVLSPKLSKAATKLPVFRQLKKLEDPKLNYLDVSINGDELSLSFLDDKRKAKVTDGEFFTSKLRQDGKVGKVLRKLLSSASDDEVREAVESLQSKLLKNKITVKVVTGKEVYNHYMIPKTHCTPGYSLQGSCYQGVSDPSFFELFELNPDKLGLVVAFKDKLFEGRALLYHGELDGVPTVVMDPPRHNSPAGRDAMIAFANENNFRIYNAGKFALSITDYRKFRVNNLVKGKGLHHWDYLSYDGKNTIGYAQYGAAHKSCWTLGAEKIQQWQKENGYA